MMHMFSLAVTPTFTIGLKKNFKYPKGFEIQCNSKPSQFAYPKHLEEKKEEKKKRVETVALSTTAKNDARLARKRAKDETAGSTDAMDVENTEEKVDEKNIDNKDTGEDTDTMDVDKQEVPEKKSK